MLQSTHGGVDEERAPGSAERVRDPQDATPDDGVDHGEGAAQ